MKMTKTQLAVVAVAGSFILGFASGRTPGTDQQTPEPEVREVVKTIEVEKDRENWMALKEIDDRGFNYAQQALGYCSDMMIAVSEYDVEALEDATDGINSITPLVLEVASQRREVLGKLGY